mgnify:CR=1 FL=1
MPELAFLILGTYFTAPFLILIFNYALILAADLYRLHTAVWTVILCSIYSNIAADLVIISSFGEFCPCIRLHLTIFCSRNLLVSIIICSLGAVDS